MMNKELVKKNHLLKVIPFPKYRELRLRYANHVRSLITVNGLFLSNNISRHMIVRRLHHSWST